MTSEQMLKRHIEFLAKSWVALRAHELGEEPPSTFDVKLRVVLSRHRLDDYVFLGVYSADQVLFNGSVPQLVSLVQDQFRRLMKLSYKEARDLAVLRSAQWLDFPY